MNKNIPDVRYIKHIAQTRFTIKCPNCGAIKVPELERGMTSYGAEMLSCQKCGYTEVLSR